jgi:hypothetical protein
MKQLDFWRAMGVGAVAVLVWTLVGAVVYSSIAEVGAADYAMIAVSAVLLAAAAYFYYHGGAVHPSAVTGFWLALAMVVYNFVWAFAGGFAAAAMGMAEPTLPEPTLHITLLTIVVGLGVPSLMGWYLGRK